MKVTVTGIDDKEIVSIIESSIITSKNKDILSDDSISLEYRINRDVLFIQSVLKSFGYFDAEIKISKDNETVMFEVVLNDRYKINDVLLLYQDYPEYSSGIKVGEVFDLLCIEFDSYTNTKQISEAVEKLKIFYKERGFAFVEIDSPKLEIDKDNKKFKVIFKITLNKKVILDRSEIIMKFEKGQKDLNKLFIKNRMEWKDGDVYDCRKIEETKENLMKTGIFSSADVEVVDKINDEKDKNVVRTKAVIKTEEAKQRDISVGASFGTTEGIGCNFTWSYYNIDGKGSRFSTVTSITKETQTQRLKYTIPDVFYKKERLENQVYVTRENVHAYTVKKLVGESILWHEVASKTELGLGLCAETSKTKDKVDTEYDKFKAAGIPIGFNFDNTNVYLDPQSGFRCFAMATPYMCKQKLVSFDAKGSFYIPFSKNTHDNRVVIACYSRLGAMLCAKKNIVPRDKMFFGGGASSIRGYGYQMLGEINDDKKPLGGESVFEIGVEPRIKVSENFGIVTFIEGGNVYKSRIPKLNKKLLWGGGLGIRYYTPLGPIRFDIAFPFKRRKTSTNKKIDSLFNIYISIGQAF
ncbi:MAG: BamA/TamA family outer membrane protein [Holosporales bacterium]|nr:BamA/TamA family outer membrane protein [Holosporales bacterium]